MSMAIPVKDDLARDIHQAAEQEGVLVEEFVERALRRQLTLNNREKLRAEGEAFRAMRADLLARYTGRYVAVHQGQVVDHDTELRPLHLRIREKYGRVAVLIKPVTEEIEERPLQLISWRFAKD